MLTALARILSKSELFYARVRSIFGDPMLYQSFAELKVQAEEQIAEIREVLGNGGFLPQEEATLRNALVLYSSASDSLDGVMGFFRNVGRA